MGAIEWWCSRQLSRENSRHGKMRQAHQGGFMSALHFWMFMVGVLIFFIISQISFLRRRIRIQRQFEATMREINERLRILQESQQMPMLSLDHPDVVVLTNLLKHYLEQMGWVQNLESRWFEPIPFVMWSKHHCRIVPSRTACNILSCRAVGITEVVSLMLSTDAGPICYGVPLS